MPSSAWTHVSYEAAGSDHSLCHSVDLATENTVLENRVLDWPKKLKLPGLTWPSWKIVDPRKFIEAVMKAAVWPNEPEFKSETSSDTKSFLSLESSLYKSWIRTKEPRLLKLINSNQFEMEETSIIFADGSADFTSNSAIQVLRFRYNPPPSIPKSNIRLKMSYATDYSWTYVIEVSSAGHDIENIPVSSGPLLIKGELAQLNGTTILFDTNFFPLAEVDNLLLAQGNLEDEYHSLSISPICAINHD